jgi:glutathione S-transferase
MTMRLYLNKASPYARLVLVVAHEKNLADRIELVWTDPWASEATLLTATPFGKVPVLVAEEGEPLVESTCICEYLDGIGSGPLLLPREGKARFVCLRKYGLGRALIDAAFGAVIQKRYAAGADAFLETRWRSAAARAVPWLERLPTPEREPDLGDLSIMVALSYLDFRMAELDWRVSAPRLAAWFAKVSARESMELTAPQ